MAVRKGLPFNLLWAERPLLGFLFDEFKRLCIIPHEAMHPDRRQHVELGRRVTCIVGQCYVGQRAEGGVDEFQVRRAKGVGFQNPQILGQRVTPWKLYRQQDDGRIAIPVSDQQERLRIIRPFTHKLVTRLKTGHFIRQMNCELVLAKGAKFNAVAESFFQLLKRERIRRRTYLTREAARQDVFDYIEMFYNPKRKHTNNGMLSPVDFETRQQKPNEAGV
jgi:Integrase core domain